ncbi:hypothetical protein, partial [Pectobacterium brasiliense]|uniref:hypothetical protein n=1 Tax=Pectobacterium brasiliense TaxID=180957 RepID=UPI0019D32C3C
MKLKNSSVNILRILKRKQPIVMSLIRKNFKTSIGALISTFFIIILYIHVFFELRISLDLLTISSIASAISTTIICFLTAKSVREVIKSNKENKQNNQARDKKESFEKKFALLLQEHNNYLGKLIKSNNLLYQLDYILLRTGYESRSIIRGNTKFVTIGADDFYYSNKNLLVKLNFFINKEHNRIYFNPSKNIINKRNLYKYNIYASNDCFY